MHFSDYRILRALDHNTLAAQVTELLAQGWAVLGGVQVAGNAYIQSMAYSDDRPKSLDDVTQELTDTAGTALTGNAPQSNASENAE